MAVGSMGVGKEDAGVWGGAQGLRALCRPGGVLASSGSKGACLGV